MVYRSIYDLAGAQVGTPNSTTYASNEDWELLNNYKQPSQNHGKISQQRHALNINEIEHLLKDIASSVPSLGQVRSCLKHLNTI